ncbi:protein of unknown function [Methylorubrum extorquens]|uniref:Uncharacterized protein n=1 Tax=Methylorubrum extorquens TaxID=408 RepID=A0A2N9APV4_METEX|nr:protein of unknown function [Methylorubrum extorquens]
MVGNGTLQMIIFQKHGDNVASRMRRVARPLN